MTRKLAKWSWVLALPLSAALASPKERAVEVPLNSSSRPATKSTPKATATGDKRSLSMRDVAPAGRDQDGVYHSIHDWAPRTPTKASSTQKATEESNHARRAHWWSRPQQVASTQKAEEVKP